MARDILKDTECRNATAQGKKVRKLFDGDGLYLWVYEDGRKYWRLRYWLGGKEKSLSLGVYPDVSLKEARNRRNAERERLDANLDPAAERMAAKLRQKLSAENSFEAVAREWYGKQVHTWVPTHARDVLRRLESNALQSADRGNYRGNSGCSYWYLQATMRVVWRNVKDTAPPVRK